jgi:glycosyltransferase involved in cell wall biosynthesis
MKKIITMNTNHKKNILFVITKSNWGGAQKYVYDLAVGLPKDIFNVTVALGGKGVLKEKLENSGIKTIIIERLGRNINIFDDISVFFKLLRLFHIEKPDIVHLNSSKIGGLGALAGRFVRTQKIVFTVHGWAFNETRGILQKTVIKLLSWITIILSHHVITVSEYDCKQGHGMPFTGKKITTIHNGISEIDFKNKEESRNELLKKFVDLAPKLDEKTVWLGTIAELHKNKGLEYAIKALAIARKSEKHLFSDLIFVVIGDGEERVNLENLIKTENLENIVILAGYKDYAMSFLKAFDIFLLPSVKEGLPFVLLEAGMAKLPSIATAVGGVPEIIDDMTSGILVQPKNPQEIAEGIKYLKKHKEKRFEFGQKLHQKILITFSMKEMLNKTMKIYGF